MFSLTDKNHGARRYCADLLFLLGWCAAAVLLFWRCRYGVGNIDESFYLTIPRRLLQGDALFLHEWHLSQMSGVLTMPIVSLLLKLNQGTEGIILSMRYVTTLIQCLLALFAYLRLRRYNRFGAACASISFMLYIPFGIMALSYNSMGIMLLVLAGLMLLSDGRRAWAWSAAAGVCFAMAVLCCPYLMGVYLVYIAAAVIRLIAGKREQLKAGMAFLSVKTVLCFTAGAAAVAAIFAAFVFSRASLGGIVQAFSQIMNDPEHPPVSLALKLLRFAIAIAAATPAAIFLYGLLLVVFIACIADRRRREHALLWFGLAGAVVLVMMVDHYRSRHYLNMVMWCINLMAPFLLLLTDSAVIRRLFYLFWIPGILYAFCLHLSSNQEFYAISSASSVSTLGTMVMIALFLHEILQSDRRRMRKLGALGLVCLIFACQLLSQTVLRYRNVFWDSGIDTQTVPVEQGIQAGLFVSPLRAEEYAKDLDRLEALEEYHAEKVLFLSKRTYYYLESESEMAGYSAWLSGVNDASLNRLAAYYELNPDKLPDLVYSEAENEEIVLQLAQMLDYQITHSQDGIILTK